MSGEVEMKSMRPLPDADRRYDNLAYEDDEQNHKVGSKNSSPDNSDFNCIVFVSFPRNMISCKTFPFCIEKEMFL